MLEYLPTGLDCKRMGEAKGRARRGEKRGAVGGRNPEASLRAA